jgi:hypothetical protein
VNTGYCGAGCSATVNTGSCSTGTVDTVFDLLNATVCPILLAIDVRVGTDLADIWGDCEPFSPII